MKNYEKVELSKKIMNGKNYYILNNEKYYTGKIEIRFNNSDKVKVTGQIEKGLKSGEWRYFYENGNVEKIETYKFGELTGNYKGFYESGELMEVGEMRYDKMEGTWKSYYKNGNLDVETSYVLNKQNGIWKKFYESGELKCECPTKNNMFYGNYKKYSKSGILLYKCFLRDSEKNGEEIYFDEAGREIMRTRYVNGREIKS